MRIAWTLFIFAAWGSFPCFADSRCTDVSVRADVEVERETLSLADVLEASACPTVRQAALQIDLGLAPRLGNTRVLEGAQIRQWIRDLPIADIRIGRTRFSIPERVVIHRSGEVKSCGDIARFVESAAPTQNSGSIPLSAAGSLDCSASRIVPAKASLELIKSEWNAGLRRWEFSLRCAAPTACVPFLVWTRPQASAQRGLMVGRGLFLGSTVSEITKAEVSQKDLLVKRGQTVILTWDQGGIRMALPVTSLEAGGLGQWVRVRLKNAPRIVRAEVVGDSSVRASL
jgi:hypothetical protein